MTDEKDAGEDRQLEPGSLARLYDPSYAGDDDPDTGEVRGTTKRQSDFHVSVRDRGMLNTMLDGPAASYEEAHPDKKCKWVYWPSSGDTTMIEGNESRGWFVVDASEIQGTPSSQKEGPIRRGDVVLMAAAREIAAMEEAQDAMLAKSEADLPVESYKQAIQNVRATLPDGTVVETPAAGDIRQKAETVEAPEQQYPSA